MDNPTQEIADRCRRIETRVTKIANHLGVEAGGDKPNFDAGSLSKRTARLDVPSRFCSLRDIVDAIPGGWRGTAIEVFIGDELLMTVSVP